MTDVIKREKDISRPQFSDCQRKTFRDTLVLLFADLINAAFAFCFAKPFTSRITPSEKLIRARNGRGRGLADAPTYCTYEPALLDPAQRS